MIVLWTDALVFMLIFIMIGLAFYLGNKEHIKRPLQKLMHNKTGIVSLVVLVFFILIGFLDSLHFRPADSENKEIISVLDSWATTLRIQGEKTYSAPFATTQYSREMLKQADGSSKWDYPRLTFGGKHLQNPDEQWLSDIVEKSLIGGAYGIGITALIVFLFWTIFSLQHKPVPINASTKLIFFTVLVLLTVASTACYLSTYYHILGTDKVGEDVFYQAIKSIRTGLLIGTLTTLIMLPMAVIFGVVAGYFQGWVDDVIQYIYTTLNSVPSVLLIAASILMVQVYIANHEQAFTSAVVRADMRLLFLCLILGVTNWTGLCRLLRAETLKLREMEYVQAAKALGVKQSSILIRHILPNVMHIVLISVVLDFSSLVLAEAVLSYINIGIDPSTYSWGNMINGARLEMAREPIVWWSLSAAFMFMFSLVLAANLFADAVQDAFDPRRSGV